MISYSALLHHITARCLPEWAWHLEWEIWGVSDCHCCCWVQNICWNLLLRENCEMSHQSFGYPGKSIFGHQYMLMFTLVISSGLLCLEMVFTSYEVFRWSVIDNKQLSEDISGYNFIFQEWPNQAKLACFVSVFVYVQINATFII